MSVTFSADFSAFPLVWGVECGETFIGAAPDHAAALEVRSTHMAVCEDCRTYGCFTTARPVGVEPIEVNMCNRNAADVLAALGVTGEGVWNGGSMSVEDLDARVQVALAVGTAGDAIEGGLSGMWGAAPVFDGGRAEGYIASRLERISRVIAQAREFGVEVTWG